MFIIGLTGGIATGKSTVSKMLRQHGFEILDADETVHNLQAKDALLLKTMVKTFGSTILKQDGTLNREALGKIIFNDAKKRAQLEAIIHPAVRADFKQKIQSAKTDILFLDVPLLFEAKFDDLTDANLVITTSKKLQLERLMLRDGLSIGVAQKKIEAQMPMKQKIAKADYVIENNQNLAQLKELVDKFIGEIKGKVKTNV